MHPGDCAMIKQVESPQVQHLALRTSSRRGRDVAQQPQHSILLISYTILDMVARQRCAKRARVENEQVATGQGAQDGETERDEHPERKGGWNSRSEATRAARDEHGEHMTFHKASRWGHSRAATGRGAGRARCGLHEHERQQ